MADMSTTLDVLAENQSQTRTAINELLDPMSSAALFGRRASTSAGLTWGFYGGVFTKADGSFVTVSNGTLSLTANTTCYIEASSVGAVSFNTTGFTAGAVPLYVVTTGAATVTNYLDRRDGVQGNYSMRGLSLPATSNNQVLANISGGSAPPTGHTLTDILDTIFGNTQGGILYRGASVWTLLSPGTSGQYLKTNGAGANPAWASVSAATGTVSSVDISLPAEFSVSGGPITTSGTFAVAKANQNANLVYAGPTSGGAAAPSFRALVQSDLPAQPYDIGGTYTGKPSASAVMLRYPMPRAVTFPAGLTGSQGVAAVAATAQTDFDLKKNGTSVGTMRFAAAATTATFIMASQTVFSAGDVLTIVAPGTPDATLSDLGWSLAGTR